MKFKITLIAVLFLFPMSLFADKALQPGDEAPRLTVTTDKGEELDLGMLYEKGPVLVYFYPKADTPGCTKQACNLRDNFTELKEAGLEVVGVSMDSIEDQSDFRTKYKLPFILVADGNKTLGNAFGVGFWAGVAYKRQSFLIVDGKVAWRDLSATPSTQSSTILEALQSVRDAQ